MSRRGSPGETMPWRFGSQVACVVALPKKARASFCVAESLTAELWGPLAPQFYFTSDDSYYAIWLSIGCLHLWRSWLPQSCLHLGRKHLPMLNTCVGVRESLGTSSFGLACVLFTISLYEHCDPKCLKACSWRWSQGQQWQTWLARTSTGPAAACFLRIAGSLRRIRRRHHRTIRNVPKQGLINAVKEATDKSEARLHDLSLLGGMSASANRIPRRMRPRRDIGF
eukprot:s2201_g11.t4